MGSFSRHLGTRRAVLATSLLEESHGWVRASMGANSPIGPRPTQTGSVAVVLLESPGKFYVAELRAHAVRCADVPARAPAFAGPWKVPVHALIGGTERGVVDFLALPDEGAETGVLIEAQPALLDKFARAQPVAAAWNDSRVQVLRSAPWADAFISEVSGFTGVKDAHDDQVDALAGAFVPFALPAPIEVEPDIVTYDIESSSVCFS